MDLAGMEQEIGELDCDFKIVYFHWGIEYQPYKSDMQEQIARKAIDSGADFVVGAHHEIRPGIDGLSRNLLLHVALIGLVLNPPVEVDDLKITVQLADLLLHPRKVHGCLLYTSRCV